MKYESKPRSRVEVEAFQWDGEIGHAPDWFREGNMGPECCMQARRGGVVPDDIYGSCRSGGLDRSSCEDECSEILQRRVW